MMYGFALALSSCASLDCAREDVLCAGLVTDTLGIEDNGVNQDTWLGLQDAKASGVVDQIAYIESVDTRDYEKNIAYFAESHYDIIITSGFGMRDESYRSASDYTDSFFIGMNQPHEKLRSNLMPVTFPEEQMGFLAGVTAARVSKTGSVGAVCETSGIDAMWRYCEGFRVGVKFANQNAKIYITYREDGDREKIFVDETWGYETAQSFIKRGADVIFAAGGVTGQGALRAADESGIQAIGAERDQAADMKITTNMITSIYGDARLEIQKALQKIQGADFGGKSPSLIKFIPLDGKYPESLTRELNETALKLWSGEIRVNLPLIKP